MSINISVPVEELRKRTLFLGVPMYGGQCLGTFTRSIADLSALCTHYGVQVRYYFLFNESLIQRARNYICDEFMRSGDSHLMFIDADIGFDAKDVIALLALQSDDSPYDVITAAYPKKTIAWEKIKTAVDKGFADENPENLAKYVGDYVFNPKSDSKEIPIGEPVEVREAGTGFMMIRRATLEKHAQAFPEMHYKPDHVRTENFDGSREIMAYFDCAIEPGTKRYLSEDYYFCYNTQKIGMKVWMCPWISLSHSGLMTFGGSLADIASLGVSATCNPADIKKKKK